MSLYLVQHGEAYPETVDPDRPLTERGKATVERMARLAASLEVAVTRICPSDKTRARQTAEILARHLRPPAGVSEMKGIHPYDDVAKIAPTLDPSANAMLVGHLPFMERLVSQLILGTTERAPIRLQQGGIVCLGRDAAGGAWFIKWALVPEMG